MRGLFDEEDDLDISSMEMKKRNSDLTSISRMACQMLIHEMAPLSSLKHKIKDLDYDEDIPVGQNDDILQDYPTAYVDELGNMGIDEEVAKILNVNHQKLTHETEDLE